MDATLEQITEMAMKYKTALDKHKQNQKAYHERHKDERRAYQKAYYNANRERVLQRVKAYQESKKAEPLV